MSWYRSTFLSFLGGGAFSLALMYDLFAPLAFVALIPIFHILYSETKYSRKQFFASVLFSMLAMGVGAIGWFWSTYPLDWLGVENPFLGAFFLFFVWGIVAIPLAISIVLWWYSFFFFRTNSWFDVLLAPSLWVLFEYARTIIFYVVTFGPGSSFGPHFTAGFLGYTVSQYESILSLAQFGGVYLVSFFVVVANIALYWIVYGVWKRKKRHVFSGIFTVFVFLVVSVSIAVGGFDITRKSNTNKPPLKTALINTYVPIGQFMDGDVITFREDLVRRASQESPEVDLVVLPEASFFIQNLADRKELQLFHNEVFPSEKNTLVIDSGEVRVDGELRSRLFFYETATERFEGTDKVFLVPEGEFLSNSIKYSLKILGQNEFLEQFEKGRDHTSGKETRVIDSEIGTVGALMCSESFSPTLYRSLTRDGAEVLVNLASHSWFRGSRVLYKQILDISRTRAVENDRWYAQASNMVPAFVLDNRGRVVSQGTWGVPTVLHAELPKRDTKTVFVKFGEQVLFIPLVIVLLAILFFFRRRKAQID